MNRIRAMVQRDDEGIALLTVILLMTMVTLFSIIILGIVVSQVTPTLLVNKNSRTLAAAQAGVDASIAQLRNATETSTGLPMGDIHQLPCTVTGTVDGTGGAAHYSAVVQYFNDDPATQTDAWRATHKLTCYTGTGFNGGLRTVPRYAVITSEGFDDASTAAQTEDKADRIIEAKYTFQLTTRKVSGGLIMDGTGLSYCLVADSAASTSNIKYQAAGAAACSTQTDLNSWSWRDDYMIHLTSTDRDGKIPLCLSGRNETSATPKPMTLLPCYAGTGDPQGQRFSWGGNYTWQGQRADNSDYGGTYIVNQDGTVDAGDKLSVSNSDAGHSVQPLSAVGKGNASYLTNQVVNQNYFGRCLDVTAENISYSYMIAYPCKQDPSGKLTFKWNHKWYYSEPGEGQEYVSTQIKVNNGSAYCLITNATPGVTGNPGNGSHKDNGKTGILKVTYSYPKFVTGANAADCGSATTTWKRYGNNDDPKKSYTFIDSNGLCLTAAGPNINPEDTSSAKLWSSIAVVPCDGSDNQKWNVPDIPVTASVGDYEEVTGRTGG